MNDKRSNYQWPQLLVNSIIELRVAGKFEGPRMDYSPLTAGVRKSLKLDEKIFEIGGNFLIDFHMIHIKI